MEFDQGMVWAFGDLSIPVAEQKYTAAASQGKRSAVLVIDVQYDFCTSAGIGSEYRGDMARMVGPIRNIRRVIDYARRNNTEVIFARFLGAAKYQRASLRSRDQALGKKPECQEGTWGAEFCQVSPDPGGPASW
ncbi:MAG TPA: isochorismatase family protein [Streptosporangiaceae bacterium]